MLIHAEQITYTYNRYRELKNVNTELFMIVESKAPAAITHWTENKKPNPGIH